MKKQPVKCSCKPNEACPHALADIFSIPMKRPKKTIKDTGWEED